MMRHRNTRPPRLLSRLSETIAHSDEKKTICGDAEEMFSDMVEEKGRARALIWYAGQLLSIYPLLLLYSIYWSLSMGKNYLKLTLRNFRRHKGYSFINVAGLAMGIACCILILLWVQDELSFDRFHENAENLYAPTFSNGSTVTPTALSDYLKTEYPEVTHASRFRDIGSNLLKYDDTEINERHGIMVDPDFLEMFTLSFLRGDPETALNAPESILISEGLARRFFSRKDPIGSTLTFNARSKLRVTGVFQDYPLNSHFRCAYILPLQIPAPTWQTNNIRTYVRLQAGTSAQSVDAKISDVVEKHRPQDQRALSLQPITRLHLNPFSHRGGPIVYVFLFSAMALFILLIACINFINLTTAKASSRAKEVGIRKTVGAYRTHLIRQFFSESLVLTFIALVISLGLVYLFLPLFNSLTGKSFTWEFLFHQSVVLGILGIILLTVGAAGSYPALFLSRFQPVKALRGRQMTGMKGVLFRRILVVLQFSLSALLILGTLMVFKQVHFLQARDVGFDRDNIVYFGIGTRFRSNSDTIRTELLSNPDIVSMTLTDIAPYRWMSNAGIGDVHWEGKTDQRVKMVMTSVDYAYVETLGLEMTQGRFFSKDFPTDATDAYVVNQAAVAAMEIKDPVGKELKVWDRRGLIVGVVEDYHFESLHNPIIPMAMRIDPNWYNQACIRISHLRVPETLSFLESTWKNIYPEYPFAYSFLDDTIQNQYRSEERVGKIVTVFTVLAVLISCLGIFGLSSYTAEQRTKEIGIRKVLGASVSSVIGQISREFIVLILVANILAWPLAYYLMSRWLQEFAYRTSIGWWTFLVTGATVLLVSLLTVSWQIIRAATANPVDSLRYE
ncbi:MAG: ABC transporter permease [Candidatus Aminicenantaceae bacterium]